MINFFLALFLKQNERRRRAGEQARTGQQQPGCFVDFFTVSTSSQSDAEYLSLLYHMVYLKSMAKGGYSPSSMGAMQLSHASAKISYRPLVRFEHLHRLDRGAAGRVETAPIESLAGVRIPQQHSRRAIMVCRDRSASRLRHAVLYGAAHHRVREGVNIGGRRACIRNDLVRCSPIEHRGRPWYRNRGRARRQAAPVSRPRFSQAAQCRCRWRVASRGHRRIRAERALDLRKRYARRDRNHQRLFTPAP